VGRAGLSGPDQLRCCGNPSWTWPAGIYDDRPHCNIQVACHTKSQKLLFYFN
jgi:hypothetical protein